MKYEKTLIDMTAELSAAGSNLPHERRVHGLRAPVRVLSVDIAVAAALVAFVRNVPLEDEDRARIGILFTMMLFHG